MAEETEFQVVRTKHIAVKPMSVEEAILQMNLLGHDFFVYRNTDHVVEHRLPPEERGLRPAGDRRH